MMVNGRMPHLLTVLAAALFFAILLLVQPYSVPGGPFARKAQQFVRAAMEQDSVRLDRLSATRSPVAWALDAARQHRDSLAFWMARTDAMMGEHSGDTTELFLYPTDGACSNTPIQFRFVGVENKAKVISARSRCIGPP
jgi:hypothetical protein